MLSQIQKLESFWALLRVQLVPQLVPQFVQQLVQQGGKRS